MSGSAPVDRSSRPDLEDGPGSLRRALSGDVRPAQAVFRLLAAVAVGALLIGEAGESDFSVVAVVPVLAAVYVLVSAALTWPRSGSAETSSRDRRLVLVTAVLDVVAVCAVALAVSEPRTGVLLMLAAVILGSGLTLRVDAVVGLTGFAVLATVAVWAADPLFDSPGVSDHMALFLVLTLAWSGLVARQIAIERRRRAARIGALSTSVQDLLRQTLEAGASERARVADLLHDDVLQLLLVSRHDVSDAIDGDLDLLPDARSGLDSATRRLRETIAALRTEGAGDEHLTEALRSLAGDRGPERPAAVDVEVARGLDGIEHPVLVAVARDLVRDAGATGPRSRVDVLAARQDDVVVLTVRHEDRSRAFGRGPADAGLDTVAERVRAIEGTLTVEHGTGGERVVTVRVPLRTDVHPGAPGVNPVPDVG